MRYGRSCTASITSVERDSSWTYDPDLWSSHFLPHPTHPPLFDVKYSGTSLAAPLTASVFTLANQP